MPKTLEEIAGTVESLVKAVEGLVQKPPVASTQDAGGGSVELTDDENDKLSELAENRAKEMIRAARTKDEVVQFVAELAGGTRDKPIGFAIPARKLTAFLLRQNDKERLEFQSYLKLMADAAVDFAEHGFSGEGFLHRPKLPVEFHAAAREWVRAGRDIKDFFIEVTPELKYEDFNVTEFETAKE